MAEREVVGILALICGVSFVWATRGIQYFSKATDNALQAYAASQSHHWRLPSDMHKYGKEKTRMKDMTVLLLAFVQRVMRDRVSDHPLVALCGLLHASCGFLLFLVLERLFGAMPALFASAYFLSSAWGWQVCLFGGHIIVANFFFLACILAALEGIWSVSGLAFCGMLYASASARKYIPFVLAAASLPTVLVGASAPELLRSHAQHPVMLTLIAALLIPFIARRSYRHVMIAVYGGRIPGLRGLGARLRASNRLEHYVGNVAVLETVALMLRFLTKVVLLFVLFALGAGPAATMGFLGGFLVLFLFFNYPQLARNTLGYLRYSSLAASAGHFRLYREYFQRIGRPIPDNMRGEGWLWIPRLLLRFAPWHGLAFLACSIVLVIDRGISGACIVGLSLAPMAWGELTRGPQLARSYFPGFLGFTIAVASGMQVLWVGYGEWAGSIGVAFIVWSSCWSLWLFFTDIYPARMASARLAQELRKRSVQVLYSYDTPYNHSFLDNIIPECLGEVRIHRIRSLTEVPVGGYVAVPGRSSKALPMESTQEGRANADFDMDPELAKWFASGEVGRRAVASFKTFGTSRIWGSESEVLSYRDLVLGEVKAEDRAKSIAWLLQV